MATVLDEQSARAEAARLQRELREHKSAVLYHKRAGRRTKMSLTQLQQMCDRAGIRLRVETDQREVPQGGQGDDPGTTDGRAA